LLPCRRLSLQQLAGLLGVESAQDAVIRTLLYERGMSPATSYGVGVAELTAHISELRNRLGRMGVKYEGAGHVRNHL
jgi:hypothetical protein